MAKSAVRQQKSHRPLDTIKRIGVEGYKSISSFQSVDIRPLTILAGANSSGKSSIFQPILLLKQTLEATYDPGPLLINGANLKFTSVEQFFSKSTRSQSGSTGHLIIEIEPTLGPSWRIELGKRESGGIRIKEWQLTNWDGGQPPVRFTPQMDSKEIERALPKDASAPWAGVIEHFKNPSYRVMNDRCFFNIALSSSDELQSRFSVPIVSPARIITHLVRGVIHLPGLRGNPERTYPVSAIGDTFDGTFETYTASVISHWERHNATQKMSQLRDALEYLGLTWKVEAKALDETQVELRVGRLPHSTQGGAYDLVNVADVGFGVSQTLPLLVALIQAAPGQIVYIEQPEIHLHPRAQVSLAKILADAAGRGVRVVIETHSSHILLAVQSLVAEHILTNDDVVLHWFSRADGTTSVSTAYLDESGAFGDWPEDFDDVTLNLQHRYLNAVESRLPGF